MLSSTAAIPDCASDTHPHSECDVERTTCIPAHGSHNGQAPEVDNTPQKNSLEMLDGDLLPALPTATTSRVADGMNQPYPQSRTFVKHSCVSDDGSQARGGGMAASPQSNEEPAITATLLRTLGFFTMYGELSVALTQGEFALVRTRLQQEWTFDGGFLACLSAVNVAMFAITADSIFKVNSYACTAVAISSSACGLGIACDVWFLVRYSWVYLRTFIRRSRDIYGSYVFFSLSSRMPTFCTLISSISLMTSLGSIAYNARPLGVLVIGILVILVMILQFIVYGTHLCATSALRVWRAGAVRASEV